MAKPFAGGRSPLFVRFAILQMRTESSGDCKRGHAPFGAPAAGKARMAEPIDAAKDRVVTLAL